MHTKMRIHRLFTTAFAAILPLLGMAQGNAPSVNPTATYLDEDGAEVVAEPTENISGQAPLTITFRTNPSDMDGYSPTYEWHFRMEGESKDLMVRYEEDTEYTFTTAGTTRVTLQVKFSGDETELDSTTFLVTISESKLIFPNAFSPNGDGINDLFKAKEYQSIVEFHAYIFNRWGQKLYDWTDPADGWDGTYNGQDVKEGVYFLLCKAKGADGTDYNIKKDVNILRGYTETMNNY